MSSVLGRAATGQCYCGRTRALLVGRAVRHNRCPAAGEARCATASAGPGGGRRGPRGQHPGHVERLDGRCGNRTTWMPGGGSGADRGTMAAREAEPGGLGQAPVGAADLADLAAEPDLAAGDESAGSGWPVCAEATASATPRSAAGSTHLDPARRPPRRRRCSPSGSRRAPLEHGEQHAPAGRRRRPGPSAGAAARCDGTTSACTSTSSGRWPSSAGATTEPGTPGRRSARNSALAVGHAGQARLGHLEQAELVGGAEAVLDRAQQAQRVVAVALEREHGVDQVLEHPRARRGAVLGDVARRARRGHAAGLGLARRGGGRTPAPGATDPGAERSRGRSTVWIESTTSDVGPHRRRGGRARGAAASRRPATGRAPAAPRRSARSAHLRAPTPPPTT